MNAIIRKKRSKKCTFTKFRNYIEKLQADKQEMDGYQAKIRRGETKAQCFILNI